MENSNKLEMAPITFEKSSISENQKSGLRVKRSVHLPNEIWLKIINYLKTKDIFGSFVLINKYFNQITPDISAIKYLQVKNIGANPSKHYNVLKVLSQCEKLIEFSIEDTNCDEYQFKSCIIKAMESIQNLKSLKILKSHAINHGTDFANDNRSEAAIEAANLKFLECLEKSRLENLEFKEVSLTPQVLDVICKMKNLKRLSIKNDTRFENEFIENLANSENQLEAIEFQQPFLYQDQEHVEKALKELFYQKQDTLKSIYLKNLDCIPILAGNYFPKLEKIYLYYFQAKVKFETKHFEQFVAQTPNLKTIEFDGHFNIHIANEFLYKLIKDRNILVMFSRNLEKKTSRTIFDAKQSSLEECLLQNPFVHSKYQKMKKKYLILCENNATLDIDKSNLSKPIRTRDQNLIQRNDDGVPNYILYLLFALFAFGCYFIFLAKSK